jgi:hypothetical protein
LRHKSRHEEALAFSAFILHEKLERLALISGMQTAKKRVNLIRESFQKPRAACCLSQMLRTRAWKRKNDLSRETIAMPGL